MKRYVLIRLGQGIITILLATMVVFWLARLTGDPISLLVGEEATEADYEMMTKALGLDQSIPVQYWLFISKAVQGDFGRSIYHYQPAFELIMTRLPNTLRLAGTASVISVLLAIPIGVIAATKRNKLPDQIAKGFAVVGQSMPGFWLGIMLIQVFAVMLGILPAGGFGGAKFLILPACAMGYHSCAGILRITRSSMLEILRSDFVRLGRIKGASERVVIWKHALRNALIPVVTFGGFMMMRFLAGSVVTETIFGWPGVGRLAYQSVVHRDFPVMQMIIMMVVTGFVIVNLVIDILYVFLDPRVRLVK